VRARSGAIRSRSPRPAPHGRCQRSRAARRDTRWRSSARSGSPASRWRSPFTWPSRGLDGSSRSGTKAKPERRSCGNEPPWRFACPVAVSIRSSLRCFWRRRFSICWRESGRVQLRRPHRTRRLNVQSLRRSWAPMPSPSFDGFRRHVTPARNESASSRRSKNFSDNFDLHPTDWRQKSSAAAKLTQWQAANVLA